LLIDLLREIDRFDREVVFFADEDGSCQVGVPSDRVLPVWLRSLSPPKMDAHDWAGKRVVYALNDLNNLVDHPTAELLAAARDAGTLEQRAALTEYAAAQRRQR